MRFDKLIQAFLNQRIDDHYSNRLNDVVFHCFMIDKMVEYWR